MMEIKRILFPTDLSETAELAKAHVAELARALGAEIVVLHVRTIFSDDPRLLARQLKSNGRTLIQIKRDAGDLPIDLGSDLTVRFVILRDISPADAILQYLETEGADLVVMGTHGRSGLKHFMLGSVAEEVVREAPCPVITVGPNAEFTPGYARILVGFDFSEHSRSAAREAARLALRLEARLQVLFVLQQEVHPAYEEAFSFTASRALPAIEKEVRKAVAETFRNAGIDLPDFQVTVSLGAGKTARDIAEFAHTSECGLIVLGTHGFSGLNRLLLGSTSEQVMRLAGCPVFTVRPARESRADQEVHLRQPLSA